MILDALSKIPDDYRAARISFARIPITRSQRQRVAAPIGADPSAFVPCPGPWR